ncbi:MAG: helix-turn-helix transcriptional regulator [Clostridia bacterium]|nr:helix-turn-helix transcriptional regulator [Clostridia bacterium]
MLATRLKELRKSRGLTQKSIADIFNLDTSSICKYESGQATPPSDIVKKFAEFFQVTTDYIYGLDDNPNPPIRQNDEVTAKLEELKNGPGYRILCDLIRDASSEDIEKLKIIHDTLKSKNKYED